MKVNEDTLKMLLAKIAGLEDRVTTLEVSQANLTTQVTNNHSQTVVNNTVLQQCASRFKSEDGLFQGFPPCTGFNDEH